jgi:hypothetical protein
MTTHDTPEAVDEMRAALEAVDVRYAGVFSNERSPGPQELATAILAAMPGWTLVPRVATADWTGSTKRAVPDVEWLVQEIADGADIRVHANGCPVTIEQDDNECRCVLRDVLAEMLPSGVETRRWREALTRIAAAEPPKWETWIARAALAPSEP